MNANTNIDLTVLHDAIVADISAQFPDLALVEFYRENRDELPRTACLLNLSEFEGSMEDDPGTEQIAVIASFEAELIFSFRTPRAKHAVRHLAAAFAAWLHKRRWNDPGNPGKKIPTGPCMVTGAFQDDFSTSGGKRETNLDQFEIWRVEWRQIMHLGQTVWTDEGVTPVQVFLGQVPEIGPGNEEDYTQVYPQ